ncbi:oxygen-independent coproporphyrinogen-3 oxidase [Geomicrobium halophilum]|uniref:Heme chaperone HemW n=1 Tax=Geomicrobium halophilum TaxID=549000 RepID=A0A841Q0D4_9BACL|nr:radical SAM family heme chaperone HemW [Geomicrobium halophilum]MBB6448818.1 oxygen-independent coproporphyrinogen-3 oxidase [Geomicrobium halophilum]
MKKGAYIHIPFCQHICHYCDFNKVLIKNQPVDQYIQALQDEGKKRLSGSLQHLDTLYVGGGTPTSLSADQLRTLFTNLQEAGLSWSHQSEVTVEVNPDGVDDSRLYALKDAGVNRLSIGVQTFDPELLETIGRTHDAGDVALTVKRARELGFNNISIDLMFALPGQTLKQWEATIQKAIELEPDHISAYGLKIEAKTQFYNWLQAGKLTKLSEDEEADMYDLLLSNLEDAGYNQYEISNFAKKGKESEHNLLYWRNQPYLALGAGAHGYVEGERYGNLLPIPHYLKTVQKGELPERTRQAVPVKEQMEEEMFLGLRLQEGVCMDRFNHKFSTSFQNVYGDTCAQLIDDGLLTNDNGQLKLTEKGKYLGNEVFASFLIDA